jgi:hypothetical protein
MAVRTIKRYANHTHSWFDQSWRPSLAYSYLFICIFDFVLAPILWSVVQVIQQTNVIQWNPITLQGAGLYHLSMGAILGVSAYGRSKEKLASINNNALVSTEEK